MQFGNEPNSERLKIFKAQATPYGTRVPTDPAEHTRS